MTRITEQPSKYNQLENKSVEELTRLINQEDKTVPLAIEKALPEIQKLINAIVIKLKDGGRMFYIGAGSGGKIIRFGCH
jgi:N-acetylmuramic acid 6-phosphate etherase